MQQAGIQGQCGALGPWGVGIGMVHTGTLFTLQLVATVPAPPPLGGQNPQQLGFNKILDPPTQPIPQLKHPLATPLHCLL